MKTLLLIAIVSSMTTTSLAQLAPSATAEGHQHRRPRNFSGPMPNPRQVQINSLMTEGREAESKGKYEDAESLYREAARMNPNAPLLRLPLARLYDKASRSRDAYVEYRAVVAGSPTSWSSSQEDPRVLARFGDLASVYGTFDEARSAYRRAASQCDRDGYWEPKSIPTGAVLNALRAAAHTSAAIRMCGVGDDAGELRELNAALAADGTYWVARSYRARAYKRTGRAPTSVQAAAKRPSRTPRSPSLRP